jgi:hypothetical protein
MVGGLVTSFAMELLVYPAIYFLWRRGQLGSRAEIAERSVSPVIELAPRAP